MVDGPGGHRNGLSPLVCRVRLGDSEDVGRVLGWILDGALGVIVGGICGGIAAVNVVIWAGPDTGYQSSLQDVFRHNPLTGIAATTLLVGGPIIGVWIARKLRHQRDVRHETSWSG